MALGEADSTGPRLAFQDRMDGGQVLPPSEAGRPAYATVIDDAHYADGHPSERHIVRPDADANICFFLH